MDSASCTWSCSGAWSSFVFAALLRWLGGGRLGESRAIDILKARYARGELTREQFEQLKREIGEDAN